MILLKKSFNQFPFLQYGRTIENTFVNLFIHSIHYSARFSFLFIQHFIHSHNIQQTSEAVHLHKPNPRPPPSFHIIILLYYNRRGTSNALCSTLTHLNAESEQGPDSTYNFPLTSHLPIHCTSYLYMIHLKHTHNFLIVTFSPIVSHQHGSHTPVPPPHLVPSTFSSLH